MEIKVSAKHVGKRRPLIPDWGVPLPPECSDPGDGGIALRDLIARIVRHEVDAFHRRQHKKSFISVLSEKQIDEGLDSGRVDSGGQAWRRQKVDPDQAVAVALEAFVDGMYLVILDGEEKRDLDEQIYPHQDSHLQFIRLTFLAGARPTPPWTPKKFRNVSASS